MPIDSGSVRHQEPRANSIKLSFVPRSGVPQVPNESLTCGSQPSRQPEDKAAEDLDP